MVARVLCPIVLLVATSCTASRKSTDLVAGTAGSGGMVGSGGTPANGGTVGSGATAGTGGPFAVGGFGGVAGAVGGAVGGSIGGGAGSKLAPCTGQGGVGAEATATVLGQMTILDPAGMSPQASATVQVTAMSVDSCASVDCAANQKTDATVRIVLVTAAGQQWTLFATFPDLPAEIVKVGDAFDLSVQFSLDPVFYPTPNRTTVLERAGKLVLFEASLSRFVTPPLPDLSPYGIGMTDGGVICEDPVGRYLPCILRKHVAHVTVGSEGADVAPGQNGRIGGFWLSVSSFDEMKDTGFCDAKSTTSMAGFNMP